MKVYKLIFFVLAILLILPIKLFAEIIWVSDRAERNLVRVSADGRKKIIKLKNFNNPAVIDIDQRDGSVWVNDLTEPFNNQIAKLSLDGKELFRLTGFVILGDAAVDPEDGSYYAAERMIGEVVKISTDGKELFRIKNLSPVEDLEGMGCLKNTLGCHRAYEGMDVNLESIDDIDISPVDSSIWVADTGQRRLLKFDKDGRRLVQKRRIGEPEQLTIGFDGSCWVNNIERGRVFKISSDGKKILGKVTDLDIPFELSVSPVDGTCWVTARRELVQISAKGNKILRRLSVFKLLQGISVVNPKDGSFWIADFWGGAIFKISSDGKILKKVDGFRAPRFLEVYWNKDS